MIAPRLLWRNEVLAELKRFGCELVGELGNPDDDGYSSSYWRTSWGHHFYVPEIGPDRLCPQGTLYAILSELSALAPENNG